MTADRFDLAPAPPIAFGPGRAGETGMVVTARAGERARVLLVTDAGLAALGLADRLKSAIASAGHTVEVFCDINGEPKESQVAWALEKACASKTNAVVALGGGSALDAGKIIAALARSETPVAEFRLAATEMPVDGLPVIAVPTTAGTGSEVTAVSVLTADDGTKNWFWSDALRARSVILDPELTAGLPPRLAASTGLDALVHAIEAATCRTAFAANSARALDAIRLIGANLPRAVHDRDDTEARGAMLLAACTAGTAIDNSGTALAHAIGHALGSLAPVPHGHAVALAMAATLDWVVEGDRAVFARVALALGAPDVFELPGTFERLVGQTGFDLALPEEAGSLTPVALAERIAAPENSAMLNATRRAATPADLEDLAARTLQLGGLG